MKRALHYFFVMFFLGRALLAQSPAGPGRAPFGSYSDSNVDSINLYNGNLMIGLNLVTLTGRELSSGLRLVYNAHGWIEVPDLENGGTYSYYAGGWGVNPSASAPTLFSYEETDCDYFEGYHLGDYDVVWQWTDSSGSAHYYSQQLNGQYYDTSHTTCIFEEILEDYLQYNTPAWVWPSSWSDPTRLRLYNGGAMVIAMEDGSIISDNGTVTSRNGNYQSLSGGSVGEDTLGRTIDFDYDATSGGWDETYTVTDANGNPQDYVLHYTTLPSSKFDPIAQQSVSMQALTSIDLPNGQSYAFAYAHDQGFMTKITLPTGAYIAYEYQGGNTDHDLNHNDVVERNVSVDGTTQSEKTWAYSRGLNGSIFSVTVTQPEGEVLEHDFANAVETATRWKPDANSNAIRTVLTQRDGHGRPTSIETQQGGLSQVVTQTWDSNGCGNFMTQRDQSDWFTTGGSVMPLARTVYTYDSNFPKSLTQVELKKWSSGSYVEQGKTILSYDQYSPASTSSVPHKSTPLLSRRNVTNVRRYKDATNYIDEGFRYDDLGNVIETIDARGKSTTISYADNFDGSTGNLNTYAYPTLVTNAEGHETETVYNYATGLPVSVFDTRGMETTFAYDELNRTTDIDGPGGSHIHYNFDDDPSGDGKLGVTEEVTVETGVVLKVHTSLDWLSRPIQVERHDPAGNVLADTEYDENGRVKRVSMPYRSGSPAWTTPTYDALDRSVTVTNPDSTTVSVAYSGKTVTTTDEAGVPRRQTFNGLGQLTKVEEPDPDSSGYLETHYSYEVFGPLAQVSQGSQTRTFTHNWLGSMTQEVHPETGTTSYTYDNGGLVTTRTDARGFVTNYIYDEIGRIYDVTYDNDGGVTKDAAYRYDQNGFTGFLTTAVVDNVSWTTLEYDEAGNLTEEAVTLTGAGNFTTAYTYDLGGRLLTVTYPSGRVVTQSYVKSGTIATDRTDELTDNETSTMLVNSVTDNAAGAITARTLADGSGSIAETRSFNSRNQLTHITAAANSATLLDMGYGYGTYNDGRIRARTDAVQPEHSAAYTFDEIGRLTAVSGGDSSWGISWTLDRFGNRTAQTPDGLAIGRVGSPSLAYWNNKMIGYNHDAAGNVTYDGSHHFYYDAENRLYKINSTDVEYAYDHAGRRIKRKVGSVTTYYVYGLTGLMSEFSTSDSDSDAVEAASDDRLQYRVGEQTGTAVMLMDSGGVPRENNRVFPFGEPWLLSTSSNNTEKFTTYQHDNDAGSDLDYAMARYYASRSGRFMTADPGHVGANVGDPQSWNGYLYVLNDPINGVDPLGLYIQRVTFRETCEIGNGKLVAEYIGTFRSVDKDGVVNLDTATTGYDCDFPDAMPGDIGQVAQVGGGGGGANFPTAQRALQNAAMQVSNMQFNLVCTATLALIRMTPAGLRAAATQAVFVNGIGNGTPYASLFANSPLPFVARAAAGLPGTIGDQFRMNPGLVALAEPGGRNIYINPALINPADARGNRGFVAHETTHNVTGLGDENLQSRLGLPITPISVNISNRLIQDCF